MLSRDTTEISQGSYRIRKSPGPVTPPEAKPFLYKASTLFSWSVWFAYVGFEFRVARSVQIGSPNFLWRMWTLLFAEICLSLQGLVSAGFVLCGLLLTPSFEIRPSLFLIGDSAPTVDVLIPCCGENLDIVMDTVAAAAGQDYPSSHLRIFVLDDGRNEKLRKAVELLARTLAKETGPRLYYLSREKKPGVKSYFKAGNLQFGIESTALMGDSSEYLASLDADMICSVDWLRRCVPHLILRDRLAMVSPQQRYYNVPESDPLDQLAEFDLLFEFYEPLADRLGAAACCGTGFVVRRRAMSDIGGWPLVNSGEDFMCSSALSQAGWEVAFLRETLQRGLAPESLRAHLKQRKSWRLADTIKVDAGTIVHKSFGLYLPGSKSSFGITFKQRAYAILQVIRDYAHITTTAGLILLPIALFPPSRDDFASMVPEYLCVRLRNAYLATFLIHQIGDRIVTGFGSHLGLNLFTADVWGSPYSAARCLSSMLPSSADLVIFASTGSVISPINERSRTRRMPLPYRLLNVDVMWSAGYALFALTPMLIRAFADFKSSRGPGSVYLFPFPGAIVKLLQVAWKASLIFRYMLWPPTVPERRELLAEDEHGINRPRDRIEKKEPDHVAWFGSVILQACMIWWFL